MKNLVVVYYNDDWDEKEPLKNAVSTRTSFEDWHERGQKSGINMFRADFRWYDEKRNVFKKAWAYRDKKWIKITEPIKPDLIFDKIAGKRDYALFDKKMRITKKIKMFNHPLFRTMVDNKLAQYLYLGEFMPKSFLATNLEELEKVFSEIKGDKVVLKPLYGSGGFGIIIDNKDNIKRDQIDFPVFIQEFVKSEKGIPGFSKKDEVSDLRMIFINHKLIYALSRIAKKGSLFTNFHQGATAVLVPLEAIPSSVKDLVEKIIGKLSIYPEANYSLDFIFTNSGKPILVEMNTTPGFDLLHIVGDEKTKQKHFNSFMKVL